MKLSIIIPCYNCSNTIERCLDSIGTNSNVAVILINDKSTDNTELIISKYIKHHPNNKYLLINNEKNLGAGETRNIGLGFVNSDYFMFADSDDRFVSDYYESIIRSLETYKSDCLIFDAWRLAD